MANSNNSSKLGELQGVLLNDENFLRRVAERFCQYLLEEEMNNHLEALPYQRTDKRKGYRKCNITLPSEAPLGIGGF